jgi:dephospho-CoA kinase
MTVIGVTGGIGSGKSTFAKMLAGILKASLFDADAAARDLLDSDPEVRALIQSRVFVGAYDSAGRPDRAAIRGLIFRDSKAKARLEEILHPRIRDRWTRMAENCRSTGEMLVVEIPLLFETDASRNFDFTVTVGCSASVQFARVRERGLGNSEAQAIIDSQLPLETKMQLSDFVVWNDGALENLREQASEIAKRLLPRN